jgi:rubredoxin
MPVMAIHTDTGTTPLDRLRNRLDMRCPECGYVDEEGRWTAATSGSRVTYQHICPSCAAVRQHTFQLDR